MRMTPLSRSKTKEPSEAPSLDPPGGLASPSLCPLFREKIALTK
jgi:hypothetical protein